MASTQAKQLKVLILDCGQETFVSKGNLNHKMTDIAREFFESHGGEVKVTKVYEPYDNQGELDKIVWSDVLIIQTPAWWMGIPWFLKKYFNYFTYSSQFLRTEIIM
ncbi:modulator of drug activity B, putative [Trichomonas vaginalis G3]|uniref:Modulator of drug activity B, putative n=1 Tax=Trichomonas vaginalis (strain ATCC PRA-98 / G3) TaxID=412133 RepID=A2EA01_TRIV3|nr:flavodoxin-like fold [Trichomonas vaginalis G3]EAY10563.1 modulator of drug activity B, putative [Trichomonas vaginalis G3]KAI5549274.1 flavodoxin-like fold [Trichomonas vaginalis G3]|eukprot:XP_001322786.1 modulator of drug activity B [Trichomonas vaginalis G3]